MNRPECGPAVALVFDDDANAHKVEDLVELLAPHDHLLVDAPKMLRSTLHLGLDVEGGQFLLERLHHLAQIRFTLGRASGDHLFDLGVTLGVQRRETQVLELPLDRLDPEAMRERRVHVESLLGNGALTVHRHHRNGAHIVQSVGEFDE